MDLASGHFLQQWTLKFEGIESYLVFKPTAGYNYRKADWEKFFKEVSERSKRIKTDGKRKEKY